MKSSPKHNPKTGFKLRWLSSQVLWFPVETRSIYVSANPVRFSKSLIPEQSSKRIPAHEQTTTRTQQTHARKGSGFQPRHFKTLGPRTLEGLEIIFFSLRVRQRIGNVFVPGEIGQNPLQVVDCIGPGLEQRSRASKCSNVRLLNKTEQCCSSHFLNMGRMPV